LVESSFQQNELGTLTTAAPWCLRGCHNANTAPVGSLITAILPTSITSKGSFIIVPPAAFAFLAASSALATETYESQLGGMPCDSISPGN